METRNLESHIEAILFAAGEPVKLSVIADVLQISVSSVTQTIEAYSKKLIDNKRGISFVIINDSAQMVSNPLYFETIKLALSSKTAPTLTPALLEVLSIVAYNQPVTKSTVDKIRGTASGYLVNKLVDLKMLTEKGRLNAPGKPILYITTDDFLRSFCLKSLNDLPKVENTGETKEESV